MRKSLAALAVVLAAQVAFAARAEDPKPPEPAQPAPPMIHVDAPAAPVQTERAEPGAAIVVIGDDGGLTYQAVRALRGLAAAELRKRGVPVVDDPRTDGIIALAQAQKLMQEMRVSRAFSVQVEGRLGSKLPLNVEELSADKPTPIYSAQLTASSIEESDVVIPRLVDAVLDRRPAADNAQLASVTEKEAAPFNKRPGEMHLAAGLVIPTFAGNDSSGSPFGLSMQLFYEIEHWNLGIEGLFATHRGLTAGGIFFQGNWLPIDGEVSPYLGAGLGYMGADSNGGLGLKLQVGVEALRLHRIRVLGGFQVMIPFFNTGEYDGDVLSNRWVLPTFFLQFSL